MPKFLKRLALILLALCALLLVCCFFRAPLLRGAANAWIVNEPLAKADVIVLLGGGRETRPFEAAKLYHQGLASKILIMNPKFEPTTKMGLIPSDADLTRQILTKQGVPASALVILPNEVTSSYEECVSFQDWAKTNAVKSMIIPTDIFHTRRVRWLFRKKLKDTGIQVRVDAVPMRKYNARDWWHNENGVIAFQNEIIKYAYYRIKY